MSEKQSYVQSLQSIDLQTIYEYLSPENNENGYNYEPSQSFYTPDEFNDYSKTKLKNYSCVFSSLHCNCRSMNKKFNYIS